jgi:hypothetical protein
VPDASPTTPTPAARPQADDPTPDAPPSPVAAPRRHGLARITAAAALAGVIVALLGLAVVALPLRTPVQDCGTAASFLLAGRLNTLVDEADPPKGTSRAEARDNNDDPCQERAADRALPAAVAVALGILLGVAAGLTEATARLHWRRVDRAAWLGASPS